MRARIARLLRLALAFALSSTLMAPAWGQNAPPETTKGRQPRQKNQPTQPVPVPEPENEDPDAPTPADGSAPAPGTARKPAAQPAQPPAQAGTPPIVRPGPYIARERAKDWTLTVNVTVRPDRSDPRNSGLKDQLPDMREFKFDTLSMVFPLPSEISSALPDPSSVKGKLTLNDRPAVDSKGVPVAPVILDKQISGELYHSGTRLLRFATDKPMTCREIAMEFAVDYRCWDTVFDEEMARQVDWPKGEIPEVSKSTLTPQIFVDYARTRGDGGPVTMDFDRQALTDLVNSYTGGNPRGAKPVEAAKFIAGRISTEFQTSGQGLRFLNTGELQGFEVQGVPQTIQNRRGSEFDVNSVLVAAFRAAGLPARLVIGYDLGGDDKKPDDFLAAGNPRNAKLRCWAEFGLYDEPQRTLTWVPVDVVRMRKSSSRMGPMDKPWKFFGNHDELHRMVPLSFGFHPPTTVESYGAPGLWGWLMTPAPPDVAYQAIRFRASSSAKTAADSEKDAKKKKKDKNSGY